LNSFDGPVNLCSSRISRTKSFERWTVVDNRRQNYSSRNSHLKCPRRHRGGARLCCLALIRKAGFFVLASNLGGDGVTTVIATLAAQIRVTQELHVPLWEIRRLPFTPRDEVRRADSRTARLRGPKCWASATRLRAFHDTQSRHVQLFSLAPMVKCRTRRTASSPSGYAGVG